MVDGGLSMFWEVENLFCVALIYENFRLLLCQLEVSFIELELQTN